MKVDENAVIQHLEKVWGADKPCPMCGNVHWLVNPTLFELPEFNPKAQVRSKNSFPVVPVICNNCFTSFFICAVPIGLIDSEGNVLKKKEDGGNE